MSHIVVIGAGITGITTAYALLEKGFSVSVLDVNRYAAMETSFANGGQLSASNAEVWNSWPNVAKGIRWMFTRDAPLLLNPSPNWHKYSWLAEFLLQIKNHRPNTIATATLAVAARKHLFGIAERERIDFDLQKRGILHVYRNKHVFEHARHVGALLKEGGVERSELSPQEMRDIEPTLRGEFYGGFYTPDDFSGDIHKFTRQLAARCVQRGAKIQFDTEVKSIRYGSKVELIVHRDRSSRDSICNDVIEADAIVVSAGVGSRTLAKMVGDRVNIYPVKGYSITVCLDDESSQRSAPQVSLVDDDTKIVTSRHGLDRFRVAGTAELNGFNRDIRADRIEPLVRWTRKHFPGVATSRVIPWSGLRPMVPSMIPKVGRGRLPRVFYNTGHGHLGWTLSAATAEIIADRVAAEVGV